MIFGIGTDLVDISRFQKMKSLNNFAKKTLSSDELKIFNTLNESKKASHLAKQFAGKEAISKAFGTGFSKPVSVKEIEIIRNEKGKPIFNPIGSVKKEILNLGILKTHVSLSDENNYAIAFAILEV